MQIILRRFIKVEKEVQYILYNLLFQKREIIVLFILLVTSSSFAQMVNKGDIKVTSNTILSVHFDYLNEKGSNLVNDGELHLFQNWDNDGQTSFTEDQNGTTFFTGSLGQVLEGDEISNFNNLVFNNTSSQIPFSLGGIISVNKLASFQNGIIEAKSYQGELIFRENATHELARNESFFRGKATKLGDSFFEYPVGDDLFHRPALHNSDTNNSITVEYFKQNSDNIYSHNNVEEGIFEIDNAEYWTVNQNSGNEDVVLSLTLDQETTPASFFNVDENHTLAIVRWDATLAKWISEGGAVSDPQASKDYQQIITAKISGYGFFTIAIVEKDDSTVQGCSSLVIHNAISPNDDGMNESFVIENITDSCYLENTVEIYNRWGVKVFDAENYDNTNNVFRGYSDGRVTISRNEKLPTGTYFYFLKYKSDDNSMHSKSGYLYLSTGN